MNIEDALAAESAAIEADVDAPLTAETAVTRGHQRTKTLQVRLKENEFDALVEMSESKGLPTSTLARHLLLTQLAATGESPRAAIARLRADLDALEAAVA